MICAASTDGGRPNDYQVLPMPVGSKRGRRMLQAAHDTHAAFASSLSVIAPLKLATLASPQPYISHVFNDLNYQD